MSKESQNNSQKSNENKVQNPHDLFFKKTLDDPEKAIGLLDGVLPSELFNKLSFDVFQKEDTSYIDQKLKQFYSDVVYTCQTKEDTPLKIAFLFEHKSYPPNHPHLQLLRYMLEIWDRQAKENKSLSLILPILIYHGQEEWGYESFRASFEGKIEQGLENFVPLFDFFVVNLQSSTYQQIDQLFQHKALRIAFRLMKSIRDEDLAHKLENILTGWTELEKHEQGRIYFKTIIVYLLFASKAKYEEVMESLYHISQDAGEFADSPAMQLIRRGREEAWAEAEARAKAKIQEAKKKEVEAKRKEAEALQKAETERKSVISKMLKAGIEKSAIADFFGFTLQKLESYIQQIQEEREATDQKSE